MPLTIRLMPPRTLTLTLLLALLPLTGCPPEKPDVVEGEGGRWEVQPPLPLGARQETAVVALRGEVIVIGGITAIGATVPLVEAFDPQAQTWRRLADVPTPMHHAHAVVVDDKIIVAGFLVGADFGEDGRTFIYDPDNDVWADGAIMTGGAQRGAGGAAALDGGVFVIGGLLDGSTDKVSRYDVAGDSWSELSSLDVPVDHQGAATIGDKIYIAGGRSRGLENVRDELRSLDNAGAFVDLLPMPTARGGIMVTAIDDLLFVAGGEGNPDDATGVFPQVEIYDPTSDEWRSVVEMRTPRHGTGACAIDGAVYVPGGADRQAFAAVDVVERFVPVD